MYIPMNNYKKEIEEAFDKHVISKITRSVEEELRIQTHSILIQNLKQKNPISEQVKDVYSYLSTQDFYLFEKKINIKTRL